MTTSIYAPSRTMTLTVLLHFSHMLTQKWIYLVLCKHKQNLLVPFHMIITPRLLAYFSGGQKPKNWVLVFSRTSYHYHLVGKINPKSQLTCHQFQSFNRNNHQSHHPYGIALTVKQLHCIHFGLTHVETRNIHPILHWHSHEQIRKFQQKRNMKNIWVEYH